MSESESIEDWNLVWSNTNLLACMYAPPLMVRNTANPAVLSDILAEDRLRINTSPIYEDDVMNVMLLSGSSDGGKVLETPKSSKKEELRWHSKKG